MTAFNLFTEKKLHNHGLRDLIAQVRSLDIHSIAVPPLGCGNGGLDWREVKPLIEDAFVNLPDVNVRLFEPELT